MCIRDIHMELINPVGDALVKSNAADLACHSVQSGLIDQLAAREHATLKVIQHLGDEIITQPKKPNVEIP